MAADRLHVIFGPTAAGKSDIALELAAGNDIAIIVADSRQIYRQFDIGTAKPSLADRERVEHFGIDIIPPTERYSAARWASDATEWLETARKAGKRPLIVGGTGLYIKSIVNPLFAAPLLDPDRRNALALELASSPIADLRRWCDELDPARAHLGRAQMVRAIETVLLSGHRISDLHAADKKSALAAAQRLRPSYLVVDPGAALAERITKRADEMLERGWLAEVRALARSVPPEAPAWKASGYSVMRDAAAGAIDLSSARERVIIETRQYAKRQRTWYRHQLPGADVTLVNPDNPALRTIVREWWEKAE